MRCKRPFAAAVLAAGLFALGGGVATQSADAASPRSGDTLQELCENKGGTYFTGRFGEPRCQQVREWMQGDWSAEEARCAEDFGATFSVSPSFTKNNRYAWICS